MKILDRAINFSPPDALEADIELLEVSMSAATPAKRFLEASLLADQKFIIASLLLDSPLPIERLFGSADWACHLQARLFTREYDTAYTGGDIDLFKAVHRFLRSEDTYTKDELFRGYEGGMGGCLLHDVCSPIDLTEKQLHGLSTQKYATFLSADEPGHPNRGYVKYPDMDVGQIRDIVFGQLLSTAAEEPNPYKAAADLQQGVIGIHPSAGRLKSVNGRLSRVLMNWKLEKNGCNPSILPDFDEDLFSTAGEWQTIVEAGSRLYGERKQLIDGGLTDRIALMGLGRLKRFHDEHYVPSEGVEVPVYREDAFHYHPITDSYLRDVQLQATAHFGQA